MSAQQAVLLGLSSDLLAELESPSPRCFGGSLLKNSHAKKARPLSSKSALHVVLKSEMARGPRSLLLKERLIHNLILKQGRKHGVKVFQVQNGGQSLQMLVRFKKRRNFQNFLRSICGLIARKTLRKERGRILPNPASNEVRNQFWEQRPFTRIVSWGPEFNRLRHSFAEGQTSLVGFLPRRHVKALGGKEIMKRLLQQVSESLSATSLKKLTSSEYG